MLRLRRATDRAAARLKAALPPRSRFELVMSGAFVPPGPEEFAYFGPRSCLIPPSVVIGASHVYLGAGVLVMEHSEIRVRPASGGASEDPVLRIGDGSRLARFVTIWATIGVHVGDRVSISDKVTVVDCWRQPDGSRGEIPPPEAAPVVIEDGASLEFGCVVGPGVTVGKGAFVGEGAVVVGDVPPHAVVYGNPARVTRCWSADGGWQGQMFGETA